MGLKVGSIFNRLLRYEVRSAPPGQSIDSMTYPNKQSGPSTNAADTAAKLWLAAGLAGIAVGVTLGVSGRLAHLSDSMQAGVAVGVGCLTMLAFSPWQQLKRQRAYRAEIRRLVRSLNRIEHEQDREQLRRLITDRSDELGELRRAIHDALSAALTDRVKARVMRRTMDDSIRRETNRATDQLRRQAATDPLTGLGNRRALEQRLEELLASNRTARDPVAALLIDVDHFKKINDELGHEAGDDCLVFLANLLQSSLRGSDHALRIGGDEFIVLMPGLNKDHARAVAERLSMLFAQMPWSYAKPAPPTLSIGLAAAGPGELSDPNELIRRADTAMYDAKRKGRARISDDATARGAA